MVADQEPMILTVGLNYSTVDQAGTMMEAGDEKTIGLTVVATQAASRGVTLSTLWLVLNFQTPTITETDVEDHHATIDACREKYRAVTRCHETIEEKQRDSLVVHRQTWLVDLQDLSKDGEVVSIVHMKWMVAGEVADQEDQADQKISEVEHNAKTREAAEIHAMTAGLKAGSDRMKMVLDSQAIRSGGEAEDSMIRARQSCRQAGKRKKEDEDRD